MILLGNKQKETLDSLKNPFNKDKITRVNIHMHTFMNSPEWVADIEFRNGNTSGRQHFNVKGADGLPALLLQMQEFNKSL